MQKTFLLLVTILCSCSTEEYELGKVWPLTRGAKDAVAFVFPPFTVDSFNKKGEESYILSSKSRYHFVMITGIDTESYYNTLHALNETKYFAQKKPFVSKSLKASFEISETTVLDLSNALKNTKKVDLYDSLIPNVCRIGYGRKGLSFIVEIDYKKILEEEDIGMAFSELTEQLLLEFSAAEKRYGWPNSICQNIVEKIFEVIPVPEEATLGRFGVVKDQERTVVMLGPKIFLQVDNAIKERTGGDKWKFNFVSQNLVYINRVINKNNPNRISIEANPILHFPKGDYPNNYIEESSRLVHLASSGDVQTSSAINQKSYIAYYQGELKRNNSNSGGNIHNDKQSRSNSYIIFSDSVGDFYNTNPTQVPPKGVVAATFGERSFLTPMIAIYINSQKVNLPLGTQLNYLYESHAIPRSAEAFRLYNGIYKKIRKLNRGLILLPGDKFNF